MAEIKWIKIVTDIFDNRKIKIIEKLPEGDTIIVIWFKLLCLAGKINDNGNIYLTEEVPYTDETLSIEFNRPLATIQLAMKTFESYGMIQIIDNLLKISNWQNYQNIEGMEKVKEQNRLRKQKQREKEKLLLDSHVTSRDSHVTVTQQNKNKNKNKNKNRIEEEEEEKEEEKATCDQAVGDIVSTYEQNIGMLSPISAEKLLAYLKDLPEEMIIKAIEIACLRNKKSTSYILGILNSWTNKGYKTLADIDKDDNRQEQQMSQAELQEKLSEERWKRIFERNGRIR